MCRKTDFVDNEMAYLCHICILILDDYLFILQYLDAIKKYLT